MGNTDSLPVVSQVKSGVQLVCGDASGAARTQKNFLRECPVVSQVTSGVQLLAGDVDGAVETQKRCGKGLLNMADGLPVVGHAKGLIHYAVGDEAGGDRAMKAATRTTGVMGGGVAGFFVAGPVGAVVGGIEGGALMDVGTTVVTGTSSGYVAAIENVVKNPNAGDIFDLAAMPVFDGLAGHSAGQVAGKISGNIKAKANAAKAPALEAAAETMLEKAETAHSQGVINDWQYKQQADLAMKTFNEAQTLKGNTPSAGGAAALKQGQSGSTAGSSGSGGAPPVIQAPPPSSTSSGSKTDSDSKQPTATSGGDDDPPIFRIPIPREHYIESTSNPTQFTRHETQRFTYEDQTGRLRQVDLTEILHIRFPVLIHERHGRRPNRQTQVSDMITQMNNETWDAVAEAGIFGESQPLISELLEFIRGHLQSRDYGGLGDSRNIIPMTRSLNALYETRFESRIKEIRAQFREQFPNSSALFEMEFRVYYRTITAKSGRKYPYAHKMRVNISLSGTKKEELFFKELLEKYPDFVFRTSRQVWTFVIRFWNKVKATVGNPEDFPYSSETVDQDEQEQEQEESEEEG